MKEIWKKIPDYKDYRVSNYGRVKSLKFGKEKILKGTLTHDGYRGVVLCIRKGKYKSYKVHQLVAMAFLRFKPNGHTLVINHKDFDKLNNHVNNIEIVTPRENSNQKHLKSSSKYVGVCWDKYAKKWKSNIRIKGSLKHLGNFDIEEDAAMSYSLKLAEINRKKELGLC